MEFKDIERLIELVEKSNIDEFEMIKKGEMTRVKIKKNTFDFCTTPAEKIKKEQWEAAHIEKGQAVPETGVTKKETQKNIYEVKSPVVGTFYSAPSPDAESFVEVGSYVKKGAILCIIEAMKIMNEIEAEISGKVTRILVENAQTVEYGEILFHIEPS